jgi:hypothetical protein
VLSIFLVLYGVLAVFSLFCYPVSFVYCVPSGTVLFIDYLPCLDFS